jgi:hypothetical protein
LDTVRGLPEGKGENVSQHENLKKWFLYFWDFRSKYYPPASRSDQVRLFIEKLQNKGQSQMKAKPGFQFFAVFVPAYTEERFWRAQGYSPCEEIEIYPRCSFKAGN